MNKYFAEFIGTFVLVLIGCGSAVVAGSQIGFLGISMAFGLAVLVMVYAIGNISGCHINPAITISMLVAGKISGKDTVGYLIAQFLGGIVGALILYLIASGKADYSLAANGLGQNGYGELSPMKYGIGAAFLAEVVLTFIFLIVIFGATSPKAPSGFAGIAIGWSLAIIHMVGIPITGTSVNPARSFGPALIVGGEALSQVWLFLLAPIIGGIVAALVWNYIIKPKET
ncbi:aquaporin Z [Acetobacteroides hydrogenigenes]|uniref:Aquaporin Z n=2 Tax=Acetobacteroides hydrogenigenes TaxID=979970 RepID=A0A4R2EQE1_9BACT|nr:aquaporin Z [Acetobacteroides hydrogenigenes]